MEHTFTDANFEEEVLASKVPVLVDFWAEWCGPCRFMAPLIEEAAASIDSAKMKIGKMNVDQNAAITAKYEIMSIPTFIIFKNGEEVERFTGSISKDALHQKMAKFFF